MGLRCVCPNGHTINVKAELAGKRGICPTCRERFEIPSGASTAVADPPVAPSPGSAANEPVAPIDSPVEVVELRTVAIEAVAPVAAPPLPIAVEWRLASPDGQQFGPTVPLVFAQWITEGRVQPDWLVWRNDWPEWRVAADVASELPAPLRTDSAPRARPAQVAPPPLDPVPPAPPRVASPATAPRPALVAVSPSSDYTARRMRGARRQRSIVVALALVATALIGVLVWLAVFPLGVSLPIGSPP
ncbi:MAG: hypothetical protein ACRCT8_05750 [Lacipirellulaceae bacterium]